MIVQFPEFYPDELVYSLLARYYTRTGYMRYIFAAEDLFWAKSVRPDADFLNQYTPDALKMLTRNLTMKQIVEKHTMFSYYGRFINKERRNKAFQALVQMQGNYHNLLPMPKQKNGEGRYLRYCPICAKEDREKYGETYWHRIHQMPGVCVCPEHGCYLSESTVKISGKVSPDLVAAELIVPEKMNTTAICGSPLECQLATYMKEVLQSKIDFKSEVTVRGFLHSRLEETPYRSVRGEQRNIGLFHADFKGFTRGLQENHFTELWQIQKVFTDDRVNFQEICMLALFLKIPVEELVKMELPEQTQEERFDKEIFRLHEQGLKYPEIARRLDASYNVVKAIGGKRYGKYHKEPKRPLKSGVKAYDWERIDRDTLPLVKDAIKKLQGKEGERPKKVSIYAVEKMLGLPDKRIAQYLPKCREEIERHEETQEKYWAREVVWAVDTIRKNGDILNWKHIRNLTNMRKKNFIACATYLSEYSNEYLSIVNTLM